jgi:hypothetical protein
VVVEWTPHVSHISTIYMYKYVMQKYFYETMKYKKMNDGIFIFLCLHGKYFLQGFLHSVKIIHMGLNFTMP